jgi:SAM-dependent methyltransferase
MVDFDRTAADYEERCNHAFGVSGETSEGFVAHKVSVLSTFWREAGLPADGRFLDLGCGTGRTWRFLHEALPGVRYTGADPSVRSIEIARRQPGADFHVLAGERLPFEEASFELVFAACVIHHVPRPARDALYAEVRRVLRPGGWFFVFEHNPWNPLTQYVVRNCELDDDAVLLDAPELAASLRRAGFERPRRGYVLFVPSSLRKRWPRLESSLATCGAGAQYWLAARR